MISPEFIDESLQNNRSKSTVASLVNQIRTDGMDFDAFFHYLKNVDQKRKWHFTWLITHLIESEPRIGNAHQELLWAELQLTKHKGIKRDLWRSFTFIKIDEGHSAEIFDEALRVVVAQNESIAVRVHAMTVSYNIAIPFKELQYELSLVLKSLENDESAGITSRTRSLLQKLRRID